MFFWCCNQEGAVCEIQALAQWLADENTQTALIVEQEHVTAPLLL